jgi:hypothetical protein
MIQDSLANELTPFARDPIEGIHLSHECCVLADFSALPVGGEYKKIPVRLRILPLQSIAFLTRFHEYYSDASRKIV